LNWRCQKPRTCRKRRKRSDEIEIGLKELDAGQGTELDVEELLREFHAALAQWLANGQLSQDK
jgi:hypothetical protein